MTEYRTNRYPASCLTCGGPVPANAGRLTNEGGRWVTRHATPAECAAKPAAPARRSNMRGQLWQECYCGTEPVCVECEKCERHCHCAPPPTADEIATERAARQAKRDRANAAREALLARIDAEGFDPLSLPIQRTPYVGMFETTWTTVSEPERIAALLDRVLEREAWYAPRIKREPMTTRLELVRHLVATGEEMNYADGHDQILRIRPEVTK